MARGNESSNVVEIYDAIMYVCIIKIWGWGYGAHGSATALYSQELCVFCYEMPRWLWKEKLFSYFLVSLVNVYQSCQRNLLSLCWVRSALVH